MSPKKRFKKSRKAARRVLEILDRLGGRTDDRHDGRRERAPRRAHYLTIRGNEDLFSRLCHEDFDYLMAQRIAAPASVREILLPQSVVGRAQNGHGLFVDEYGVPYSFREATFDRVLTELEKTWPHLRGDRVRERRQRLVDAVADHVLAHLDSETMPLDTADGPLLGVEFLAGRTVRTADFLRGLVLAGFMDDHDQRRMCASWHRRDFEGRRWEIGGGDIRVVDRESFRLTGIIDGGREPWDDAAIRELESLGVIVKLKREGPFAWPRYDQAYFRRTAGDGVCDDLAMIRIGAEHGFDGLLGAFVMDALDTYDKHVSVFRHKGSDQALAETIQEAWTDRHGRPLVGGEAILDLIWFAAKNNAPRTQLSSSHRRLIQTEAKATAATLLQHWRFLQGEPLDDFKLGFARVPAREFYATAHARLLAAALPARRPVFRATL